MTLVLQISIFLAIVVIFFSAYMLYKLDTSATTEKVILSLVILVASIFVGYSIYKLQFIKSQVNQIEELLDI